ncbi:hypothetical protein Ancab_004186 [Ancistrocladus abbreviatus]
MALRVVVYGIWIERNARNFHSVASDLTRVVERLLKEKSVYTTTPFKTKNHHPLSQRNTKEGVEPHTISQKQTLKPPTDRSAHEEHRAQPQGGRKQKETARKTKSRECSRQYTLKTQPAPIPYKLTSSLRQETKRAETEEKTNRNLPCCDENQNAFLYSIAAADDLAGWIV